MKRILYYCLLLCICFIASCKDTSPSEPTKGNLQNEQTPLAKTPTNNQVLESVSETPVNIFKGSLESDCIPPIVTLAFPRSGNSIDTPLNEKMVHYLPAKWLFVSDLPNYPKDASGNIQLIRKISGHNEIWITSAYGVLRYSIETQAWSVFNKINNRYGIPEKLFLGQKGELWGIGFVPLKFGEEPESILSLFNDSTERFEPILDHGKYLGVSGLESHSALVGKNGILWMVLEGGANPGIYNFDPNTRTVQLNIPSNQRYEYSFDIEYIAQNNSIVIAKNSSDQILQYFPLTQTIKTYNIPEDIDRYSPFTSLYMDQNNHLWVDDRGWLDFSNENEPIWYQIIRSPVFIYQNTNPASDIPFLWDRPKVLYESSNGLLWFQSVRGTAWLDPKKATWCLFTNARSDVVEDLDHSLWIISYGKIYHTNFK